MIDDKLEAVHKAVSAYLIDRGWKSPLDQDSPCNICIFSYIDPITGFPHRADFAMIIQSEREINKVIEEKL